MPKRGNLIKIACVVYTIKTMQFMSMNRILLFANYQMDKTAHCLFKGFEPPVVSSTTSMQHSS